MADEDLTGPVRRRAGAVLRRLARDPRVAALGERLALHSVRTRTTIAACVGVTLVLLAASATVLLLLRVNLERTVETGAREQAQAVARLAGEGHLPRSCRSTTARTSSR